MDRTVYKNRVLVDQLMLNNTESTKISAILDRQKALGSSGVVFGLRVSPFSGSTISISVGSGQAVLPNGEIVTLNSAQNNLPLADSSLGAANLICLSYNESFSQAETNELGKDESFLIANNSPIVSVLSVDDYLALPVSSVELLTQTIENTLIIGVVVAKGTGVPLTSDDIVNITSDSDKYDFGEFRVLKSIVIKSSNVNPTSDFGQLKYEANANRRLLFVSPNNTSPPAPSVLGSSAYVIDLSQDVKDVVLTDPQNPEEFLVVDIYGTALINSINSIEATERTNLQNEGKIVGSVIIEDIDFKDLYNKDLTSVNSDDRVDLPKSSAVDRLHRDLIGTNPTSSNNPHGLSLADIVRIFENIPGSIRVGNELLATPEESVYARIKAAASSASPYTLLLETELEDSGALGISPLRVYINSFNPNNIPENPSSVVQLSGLSITLNSRFSSEDNLWYKDNEGFPDIPAVKFELGSNSFNVSMNTGGPNFEDSEGWVNKIFTDVSYSFLRDSLAIFSRGNSAHNDSSIIFSALINAAASISASHPNRVCLYEDVVGENGGMRIYLGNSQTTGSGSPSFDFILNAKPRLGSSVWEKDVQGNSYMFRYSFEESEIRTLEQTSNALTFTSWDKTSLRILNGFTISDTTKVFSSETHVAKTVRYSEKVDRSKIVPLGDIGHSISVPYTNNLGSTGDSYFDRNGNDERAFSLGVPAFLNIENMTKNYGEANTPRLVWRGPQKHLYASNTKDGNDSDADVMFMTYRTTVPNQILRFNFPLYFEEPAVDLMEAEICWDWCNDRANTSGFFAIQDLPWNQDLTDATKQTFSFRVTLEKLNLITGESELLNPNVSGVGNPINYVGLGKGTPTEEQVLRIRNSDSEPFYEMAEGFLEENEILQLVIQTNLIFQDVVGGTEVVRYRPLIIGNMVVKYRTLYVE